MAHTKLSEVEEDVSESDLCKMSFFRQIPTYLISKCEHDCNIPTVMDPGLEISLFLKMVKICKRAVNEERFNSRKVKKWM